MKKSIQNIVIISIIMILSLFQSCSIETYSTKKTNADEEIMIYINSNGLNVKPEMSGLVFIPLIDGEGICPNDGDKVAFHYTGYYLNGEQFDSSYEKSFPLIVELGKSMIIEGLEEAIKMMNKGAKAKLIIPFYLAYDNMENAPVPPYSNLVFEIELIDFTSENK